MFNVPTVFPFRDGGKWIILISARLPGGKKNVLHMVNVMIQQGMYNRLQMIWLVGKQ